MERKFFKNHKELADFMFRTSQDGLYTVAVLFYDDAMHVTRELLGNKETIPEAIEIKPQEYNGYDREYYVSITEDMIVSAEPAYCSNRYLRADADLTLLDGSISAEIINYVDSDSCIEVAIGFDDGFEYEDELGTEDDDWEERCQNNCCLRRNNNVSPMFDELEYIEAKKGNKIRATMGVDTFLEYFFG